MTVSTQSHRLKPSNQLLEKQFSVFFMAEDEKKINTGRRNFIKYGIAGVIGAGVASAIELPILNN